MPDISQMNLYQWCVVWRRSDTKSRYGQARVLDPINVRCRWLISEQEGVTQDGSSEQYPRTIPVNQAIALGSYVWGEGKITDLPDNPQYWEVVGYSQVPDLKGRHYAYQLTLQKVSKELPDLA